MARRCRARPRSIPIAGEREAASLLARRDSARPLLQAVTEHFRINWPPEEGKIRFATVEVAQSPTWRHLADLEAEAEDMPCPVLVRPVRTKQGAPPQRPLGLPLAAIGSGRSPAIRRCPVVRLVTQTNADRAGRVTVIVGYPRNWPLRPLIHSVLLLGRGRKRAAPVTDGCWSEPCLSDCAAPSMGRRRYSPGARLSSDRRLARRAGVAPEPAEVPEPERAARNYGRGQGARRSVRVPAGRPAPEAVDDRRHARSAVTGRRRQLHRIDGRRAARAKKRPSGAAGRAAKAAPCAQALVH